LIKIDRVGGEKSGNYSRNRPEALPWFVQSLDDKRVVMVVQKLWIKMWKMALSSCFLRDMKALSVIKSILGGWL